MIALSVISNNNKFPRRRSFISGLNCWQDRLTVEFHDLTEW